MQATFQAYQRLCVVPTAGRFILSCTFQLAVLAALCGTDGGSCHFHCTVLAALCGVSVCLCLFLLLNVVYLAICAKLWLVVGMTKQMSNGKEVDIVNC